MHKNNKYLHMFRQIENVSQYCKNVYYLFTYSPSLKNELLPWFVLGKP